MKHIIIPVLVFLSLITPCVASSDLENRVSQLEESVRHLYELLETRPQSPAVDRLIGGWTCSNGVQNTEVFFQRDGQFLQKEPVLGNTKTGRWIRTSDSEISLERGVNFSVMFDTEDQLTVEETNIRATWSCNRIRE